MFTRREQLIRAGAKLFAERGYHGVSIEDLGAAVGVSGPAVYKHFSSKSDLLRAMLVEVSEGLLAGAERVCAATPDDPRATLEALIDFHIDFALRDPDVIAVQDRDLASLSTSDARKVRSLQRGYVEKWVAVMSAIEPSVDYETLRIRAHACFGMLNSTPHSAARSDKSHARAVLRDLGRRALVG